VITVLQKGNLDKNFCALANLDAVLSSASRCGMVLAHRFGDLLQLIL
jgi:hypothetical protein